MRLLPRDPSSRQSSITRQLTSHFVEVWKAAHPQGWVVEGDLATTHLPAITDDRSAASKDASLLSLAQQQYLATSNRCLLS
jgi:FMN-dependent NADH-azoreductase